jgi:uncharacterized protein YciI
MAVNIDRCVDDAAKIVAPRPSHRAVMKSLTIQGRVVAARPFTDGSGAPFIYEVESLTEAEGIVADDPHRIGGALRGYELKPWHIVDSNPAMLAQPA